MRFLQTVALRTSYQRLGFSAFEASNLRQPILVEPKEDEIKDADELVFMVANQYIPAGSEVISCRDAWEWCRPDHAPTKSNGA